jgi:FkbH-like protein
MDALPADFDGAVYLDLNPDVRAANVNPSDHYLAFGRSEGRRYKKPASESRLSDLPVDFDPAQYLVLNPDIAVARWDPVEHWLQYGKNERRRYKKNLEPVVIDKARQGPRFAFIGTCGAEIVAFEVDKISPAYHFLWAMPTQSDLPLLAVSDFDAIVVVLTLRDIFSCASGGDGDLFYLRGESFYSAVLKRSIEIVNSTVDQICSSYEAAFPVLFLSMLEPPPVTKGFLQNGRKYSIYHAVRSINDAVAQKLADRVNSHYIEINDLRAQTGDIDVYDGYKLHFTHGGFIGSSRSPQLIQSIARRIRECYDICADKEKIKLIITDLDNTLWKGVLAEYDEIIPGAHIEGWPLGYVEALLEFKRRGGILAISSKNDEVQTRLNFQAVWGNRIRLDDFVSIKINWEPKSKNVLEILAQTNIAPQNCLFIDDNHLEIEDVRLGVPGIFTLTGDPENFKSVILYSPKLQWKILTEEAANKTNLIKAKLERDKSMSETTRSDYLRSLDLRVVFGKISDARDPAFIRADELINKTNQFNTTGRRWSHRDFEEFFSSGGWLMTCAATDRFGKHGVVGVAMVEGDTIVQFVLSCRVFGLGLESALLRIVCQDILNGELKPSVIFAKMKSTGRNAAARDFYKTHGFSSVYNSSVAVDESVWESKVKPEMPGWIKIV